MLRLPTAAFAVLALIAVPAPSRAVDAVEPAPGANSSAVASEPVVDVVTRSGARFRGVVVKRDERRLHLRTASGVVRELPVATIARIEEPRETPPVAAAKAEPAAQAAPAAPALRESRPVLAGIGVAIPTAGVGFGGTVLFFPIQLGSVFRVEPELGYVRIDGSQVALVGLGLFVTRDVAPQVRAYVGPRIEYATGEGDNASAVGLAVGGEWLPVPRVALGAEGRISAAWGGASDVAGTSGLFFVRVFLN
jgi:hypothetical protein